MFAINKIGLIHFGSCSFDNGVEPIFSLMHRRTWRLWASSLRAQILAFCTGKGRQKLLSCPLYIHSSFPLGSSSFGHILHALPLKASYHKSSFFCKKSSYHTSLQASLWNSMHQGSSGASLCKTIRTLCVEVRMLPIAKLRSNVYFSFINKYGIDIVFVNVKGVQYERILLNPFLYCNVASLNYWLEYIRGPPQAQTGEIIKA